MVTGTGPASATPAATPPQVFACGCCGHASDNHHRGYCRACDCTALLPQPRCSCGDGWDWRCRFHGRND